MDEERLGKAALICSLIGLIGLLLLTEEKSEKTERTIKLTEDLKEKEVRIQGAVKQIIDLPSIFILILQNKNQEYKVVGFKNKESIDLKKGQEIVVTGMVKEYKGNLEIEAPKIKRL
jgi:aspartyl/asparaginyl-tRNA synthetase